MWWLCNIINVLNATELNTLKWLILCYVNSTSVKIVLKGRKEGREGGRKKGRKGEKESSVSHPCVWLESHSCLEVRPGPDTISEREGKH